MPGVLFCFLLANRFYFIDFFPCPTKFKHPKSPRGTRADTKMQECPKMISWTLKWLMVLCGRILIFQLQLLIFVVSENLRRRPFEAAKTKLAFSYLSAKYFLQSKAACLIICWEVVFPAIRHVLSLFVCLLINRGLVTRKIYLMSIFFFFKYVRYVCKL